ncbi:pentapeptide repeat-containing protein [Maridesulfovibrio sp.]|uniref:pentapeptide repeat-containing protein n=1 Tax=Maridesulfovibrio sp. TaxID=2795000 RepID=UPI0029CA465D|nr:pentapeptide repeat-containing protein [Maridesulfovibrio sp.]
MNLKKIISIYKTIRDTPDEKIYQLLANYLGVRAIWEKLHPPTTKRDQNKPKPSTFILWAASVYIALFSVASSRYDRAVNSLAMQISAFQTQMTTNQKAQVCNQIRLIQQNEVPYKPDFKNPLTVFYSFYKYQKYEEGFQNIIQTINSYKKDLLNAQLNGADLSNIELIDSNIQNATLLDANLSNAILWNANLKNANLWRSNLEGCEFCGANLQNVDLTDSNITDTDFFNADLTNAKLINVDAQNAQFKNAILIGTQLQKTYTKNELDYSIRIDKRRGTSVSVNHKEYNNTEFKKHFFMDHNYNITYKKISNYTESQYYKKQVADKLTRKIYKQIYIMNPGFGSFGYLTSEGRNSQEFKKKIDISVAQLAEAKTLYKAKLPPKIEKKLKQTHPHLFEKPDWYKEEDD